MNKVSTIDLLKQLLLENNWWIYKQTRYISIRHDHGCPAQGLDNKNICNCNPEIRLMYNADTETKSF